MGTEVLFPQEFHHVFTATTFHRRRNLNFNGKSHRKTSPKREKKKINDVITGIPVNGKVTLLRRGESLDSLASRIEGVKLNNNAMRLPNRKPIDDLTAGRIGPDSPEMAPECINFPAPGDGYAGPGCSLSPSPRSLPMPLFTKKNCNSKSFDDLATTDLRRLLRLN